MYKHIVMKFALHLEFHQPRVGIFTVYSRDIHKKNMLIAPWYRD